MWNCRGSNASSKLATLATVLLLLGASSPEVLADADDYWFAFPDQNTSGSSVFTVEITAENGASGTVGYTPFSLLPGESVAIPLPPSSRLQGSGYHPAGGVHVQTNAEISVTVFMSEDGSGDAMRPLPESELGTEYVVVSSPAGAGGTYPSQFLIVGTVDNTTVSITASDINAAGLVPGVATDINLDLGQVYQVQAPVAGSDLTGTVISATEPVAVISGHYLGLVPASESCCGSFMAACLPPVSAWGANYFVAPTITRTYDVVRVVAWSDGTLVNAPGHAGVTLGRGESIEFTTSQGTTVTASGPVMVAQYFTSSTADGVTAADPALMIPAPREAWGLRRQIAISSVGGVSNYLHLITTTADTASVTLDGGPLAPGIWLVMGELSFAILGPAPGPHVVEGSQPLDVRVYGFKAYWSYGYYCRGAFVEPPPPVEPPENPVFTSLVDVPNDQGRQIRLTWARSSLDTLNSADPITQYVLYRRHDSDLKLTQSPFETVAGLGAIHEKDDSWDFVGTVPAFGEDSYAAVVPTLADSTITDGPYWSFFMVRAATSVPTRFFDSEPDSGYSLDNLAPSLPTAVVADYAVNGVVLDWDDAPETDFRYYRVYRGTNSGFVPSVVNLVQEVAASAWTDPLVDPWGYYYKITVLDHAGNESEAGSPGVVSGAQDSPLPAKVTLLGAAPNPFNPQTTIAFELPRQEAVRLRVFDVSGRLVSVLVDGETYPSGRHETIWTGRDDTGRRVSSGTYFYRLEAGEYSETKRMALIK